MVAVSASSSDVADLYATSGQADTLLAGTPYTAATDEAILEYTGGVTVEVVNFPTVNAVATGSSDTEDDGLHSYVLNASGGWTL